MELTDVISKLQRKLFVKTHSTRKVEVDIGEGVMDMYGSIKLGNKKVAFLPENQDSWDNAVYGKVPKEILLETKYDDPNMSTSLAKSSLFDVLKKDNDVFLVFQQWLNTYKGKATHNYIVVKIGKDNIRFADAGTISFVSDVPKIVSVDEKELKFDYRQCCASPDFIESSVVRSALASGKNLNEAYKKYVEHETSPLIRTRSLEFK